jgi:hypothetical protein
MVCRSLSVSAIAVSPLACCALLACSSGGPGAASVGATNPPDAGTSTSMTGTPPSSDGSTGVTQMADSGTVAFDGPVASSDSGVVADEVPDGCAPAADDSDAGSPVGTLLVGGNALSARGVTSDGYEIYSDDFAGQAYAVPTQGGSPQSIVALGSKFWIVIYGKAAFIWSNVTGANVGALTVWSSAKGTHAVEPASFGILGASSPDGTQILFVGGVDSAGATGNVYVAGVDGSSPAQLVGPVQLAGCYPQLGFVGSYAVSTHCDMARGNGPSATISSFTSTGRTRADLVTNAENSWSSDAAGTKVLVSTASGILVVPVAGGASTIIDPQGFLGQLISVGATAIYGTTSGQLRSASTTSPSPMTLATSWGGFYAVSPDQNKVLYYDKSNSSGTDIDLAATTSASSARAISTATNGTVSGDAFTADSTYALYATANSTCTGASTFNGAPVSGGNPVLLGQSVWSDWAATGAKVVFNDNYAATGGLRFGRADVEVVNLASGSQPTRIVSGADAVLDLSPAKDQIIYSWSLVPGPLAGIYVTSIP